MLEPVKNWYNVTFDVAFWVVMHLFVCGAFQDIQVTIFFFLLLLTLLQTKEDFITNKERRLLFKPELLDKPL